MKKIYVLLIIIIILLSFLAACVNDAGVRPDTGLPQKSQPTAAAAITPKPTATATVTPMTTVSAAITPSPAIWPEEYSAALAEYKIIADYNFHDIYYLWDIMNGSDGDWLNENIPVLNEAGITWDIMLAGDDDFWKDKDVYGYALKDLNGDGSDELILLLKDYSVLAIYSIVDGKLELVDYYWSRYDCYAIDKSGLFYIFNLDTAGDWWYAIERLSDDGSELLLVEQYGMESFDYDTDERYPEPRYYKVTDGKSYSEREIITEAEFDEFYEKHPAFFGDWEKRAEITKSALVFIPILDCNNSGDGTYMFVPPAAAPTETVQIRESKKPRSDSAALIDRNRELYTLKSGDNYVVYRFYNDDDEEDFFYYRIEVYNDDGKMIFHDEFDWPEPIITYVSKDVIQIDMPTGTGLSKMRYCDLKRGLVSEAFDIMEPIIFVDGILIQRGNGPGLTLSAENVFDKAAYYKEFPVDAELCTLVKLQLIDEQTIEIESLRYDEDGEHKKTTTITLG